MTQTTDARRFVPADCDPGDWGQLEPLYHELRDRELATPAAVEQWLRDFSELTAVVSEAGARRRIAYACHTEDARAERAYLDWVEQIAPRIKPAFFQLQQKFLSAPGREQIESPRYEVLEREWRADVELFREENIPLQTEVTRKISEYDKAIGAMVVEFRGEQHTLQQLGRFLESPDRRTRAEAWQLAANRRLEDREKMEGLFDELLDLRRRIATHAGLENYRAYAWKARGRFDYGPEDCHAFAEAVEQVVVPLVDELDERRRRELNVERLRPWDLAVDPEGREPLHPFDADRPEDLVGGVRQVLRRVSPDLGEPFEQLEPGRNLDLASRRGKRAGGFQAALEESGEPFIFMNAAGLHRDVETLLHESGHAFHFLWAREREPLVFLLHAPMEFAEVASMSLELLGSPHLEVFYPASEDRARARRRMLEGILRVLPWIAAIDQFQHWLYTHPDHTPPQRREAWLGLMGRFGGSGVDWSGYESSRAHLWHKQLHLFHQPFYYMEYGIAQLGALQLWEQYGHAPRQTLQRYRTALSLGGTRPLPELFEAAGLTFDFTRATIEPRMTRLREEWVGQTRG